MTLEEFDKALTQSLDARNRYQNRSGFSAHQRVFGSALRLPGCLLSDDPVDGLAVNEDPTTDFHRTAEIRSAAQRAFFKNRDAQAVHRAVNSRSRALEKQILRTGDIVYVWRNKIGREVKGWIGPGVVVAMNDTQSSVWVTIRGALVKCNSDRVR